MFGQGKFAEVELDLSPRDTSTEIETRVVGTTYSSS